MARPPLNTHMKENESEGGEKRKLGVPSAVPFSVRESVGSGLLLLQVASPHHARA